MQRSRVNTRSVRRVRRNQNTMRYQSNKRPLGPISNALVLALIVGLSGLLYLTQVTKTSVYGFEINSLSDERTQLMERNNELRAEAARLQSVDRVRAAAAEGKFQAGGDVGFVEQ